MDGKIYGYKAEVKDYEQVLVTWVPSRDPEDLLLPDHQFIVCSSQDEAVALLAARNPCPPRAGATELTRVWPGTAGYSGGGPNVVVSRYPATKGASARAAADCLELVAEYGAVLIDPPPFERPHWSGGQSRTVKYIRDGDAFDESDMVISEIGREGLSALVKNPLQAKARRTRRAGTGRVARKDAEAERKRREEHNRKEQLREAVRQVWLALERAADLLWADCVELKAVGGGLYINTSNYCYARPDVDPTADTPVKQFFKVVAVHEKWHRRDAWRKVAGVRDQLLKAAPAQELLGTESDGHRGHHTLESLERLRAEVNRAVRSDKLARAREAKAATGGGDNRLSSPEVVDGEE